MQQKMPPKATRQKKSSTKSKKPTPHWSTKRAPAKATPKAFTSSAMRRIARRGGVKRLARLTYEEVRGVVHDFVKKLVSDAMVFTEHRRASTVVAMDVVHALKRQGRQIYGYV